MLTGAGYLAWNILHRKLPSFSIGKTNYGPTECTVVAYVGIRGTGQPAPSILPSIGRPMDNTHVYILDENLEQVPVGTVRRAVHRRSGK